MITAFKDIGKIIEESTQQAGGEITQLDFSSVKIFRFTENIKSMVEKCTHLSILKLVQCQLNSLQKLPDLDITGLDVSINKIKDSDLQHLTKYKNLCMLNLSDNFITSLSILTTLKMCTKLKDLELAGNDIENLSNYRQEVFSQLTNLQYLDKLDKHGLPPPYESHSDDIISDLDEDEDEYEDQDEDQFQQSQEQSQNYEEKRKYRKISGSEQDS